MNPELVRKFFEGKCSPEEVHQVLIWINSEEGVRELEEKFQRYETGNEELSVESQPVLANIHKRIADLEENDSFSSKSASERSLQDKLKSSFHKKWKLGIAVSFMLAIMASAVWLFTIRREEKQSLAASSHKIEYLTKQTRAGEKLTLKLNDGTIIQLNSNSKIRFPKTFSTKNREVFMEGQAFFEVHRDENRPFMVHSKGLVTSVLGTSFAIVEDSATLVSQVAVLTGKVKVVVSAESELEESEELYLEPMDAASFDGLRGSFEKIKVDYDHSFAWKDNVIIFRNASFGEVLKKLENWYGVKFQMKGKIKEIQDYTGRFEDQTLEEILIGLSFTYDFEFDINNETIIIH